MNNHIIYDCTCLYISDINMYTLIIMFHSSIYNFVSIFANLGSSLTFARVFYCNIVIFTLQHLQNVFSFDLLPYLLVCAPEEVMISLTVFIMQLFR